MKNNKLKVHFMGIKGSGLAGVYSLASKMGFEVSGCDLLINGHSKDHLKDVDLLVATPAVFYQSKNNSEVIEGKRRNILLTWQEFLGKYLIKDKKIICIAGTHGKSTTTAMAGKLLEDTKFDPSVVVGANVFKWEGSSRFGNGKYFVIEADEFYDNFLNYSPDIIILNNIEFDHPDYFKDEEMLFSSFEKFIKKLKGDKVLIVNSYSEGVLKLLNRVDLNGIKLIKYNLNEDILNLNLAVPGVHNVTNALGVVKLGNVLKINDSLIKKSLESFTGIERRLQLIGEENNIKIYDDYAHHPTAITATLEALKSTNLKQKIWAVVEPHGFDRTYALIDLYKDAFKNADRVIIGPIFKARDKKTHGLNPQIVAKKSNFTNAVGVNSLKEIIKIIKKDVKKEDTILVMGAGKSNIWAREILKSLKKIDISFKDLTTLKIGGKIKYYKEVNNKDNLVEAVLFAKKNKLPIFIIGSGSDILVSDKDFEGLVIRYIGNSLKVDKDEIRAEAGVIWDDLVNIAVENDLQGMECLSGIPGTVGASPVQNIGAYGQELKDTFLKLTAYDIQNNKFIEFNKKDCDFKYRESFFKDPSNFQKFVIVKITFKLKKNKSGIVNIKYDSLKRHLDENNIRNYSLKNIRKAVLDIRAIKLEDPKVIPNAGSFFKNPTFNKKIAEQLQKKYPDIPIFENSDGSYKCFAGWLIDNAGWKGKSLGNVKVSDRNALILVNPEGKGNYDEMKKLSSEIIKSVKQKFNITLELEVQFINI